MFIHLHELVASALSINIKSIQNTNMFYKPCESVNIYLINANLKKRALITYASTRPPVSYLDFDCSLDEGKKRVDYRRLVVKYILLCKSK